jgi:hypothetical protein
MGYDNVDTITWNEFKAHFHTHYISRGTMKLKRKEFTGLKQGSMTVNEYFNSFILLSRYAPDDINTDEEKHDMFLNGLTMIFNSHCSTQSTQTSNTWPTGPLLLKTRLRKWRRMARGRCHSKDNPQEATLGLASHNLTSSSNQAKPQGQQNFMNGRVNQMTSVEVRQAQDVVLGMFLTHSHPTTILFNSRASHPFISSSFVVKHILPIATMKHTMLVSSPGGEMWTKHICPAVSITIRGVDFPSNLILLDSKGIDIILGMD